MLPTYRTLTRSNSKIRLDCLHGLTSCGIANSIHVRTAFKALASTLCKVLETPVVNQSDTYDIHIQCRLHLVNHFATYMKSEDLDAILECRLFATLSRLVRTTSKTAINNFYANNLWKLYRLVALLCLKASGASSQTDSVAHFLDPLFHDLKQLTKADFVISGGKLIRVIQILAFLLSKMVRNARSVRRCMATPNWVNLLFHIAMLHLPPASSAVFATFIGAVA